MNQVPWELVSLAVTVLGAVFGAVRVLGGKLDTITEQGKTLKVFGEQLAKIEGLLAALQTKVDDEDSAIRSDLGKLATSLREEIVRAFEGARRESDQRHAETLAQIRDVYATKVEHARLEARVRVLEHLRRPRRDTPPPDSHEPG